MRTLIAPLLMAVMLALPASVTAQLLSPNPTVLSTRADGSPGQSSGFFFSAMSADARYVVVLAIADDLIGPGVSGSPITSQQFLRIDRQTGERRVVSVNAQGEGQAQFPVLAITGFAISLSDDGRRVIFNSTAMNFEPPNPGGSMRCYLWDQAVGHAVAVDMDPNPGVQARPCGNITADGREVVGLCSQTVPNTTGFGVCVRNLDTGIIERLAIGRGAGVGTPFEALTKISADGSVVAFGGWQGRQEIGLQRVDRSTGEIVNVTNVAASPLAVSLSHDGRFLLADALLYDHVTGQLRTVIRYPPFAFASRGIYDAGLSQDGRFVSFRTSAAEFERPFTGLPFSSGRTHVYRLDLATNRLDLISRLGLDGPIANGTHDFCEVPSVFACEPNRLSPRISGDGRYVVFQFQRVNLAPTYAATDPQGAQLFIKDLGPATPLIGPREVPLDRRWMIGFLGLALLLAGVRTIRQDSA